MTLARPDDPRLGLRVTHRRYVPYATPTTPATWSTAPTASRCFGDVATEVCIRTDGDEGLFASYSDVQFQAPVRAGDVIEVDAEVMRVGTRTRTLDLEVRVMCRGAPDRSAVGRRGARPADSCHHGHRHGRRTELVSGLVVGLVVN